MIYRLLFAAVLTLLLTGCDDEVQYYEQYKVEGDSFSIEDRDGQRFDFSKGDLVTFYNDEAWFGDWNRPVCQLVYEGRILSDYVTRTPSRAYSLEYRKLIPVDEEDPGKYGLSFVRSGNVWKDKEQLSFMEYYDLLREVSPLQAQARRWFLWTFLSYLAAVALFIGAYVWSDSLKQAGPSTRTDGKAAVVGIFSLFALSLVIPGVTTYLYFYFNPLFSMWFINDVGFFGFCAGFFVYVCSLLLAVAPASMLGQALRQTFSREWKEGLFMLTLSAAMCVAGFYYLKLTLPQIWDQCGFIIKSVGVLILCLGLPGGLASGFSSSDNGPSTVSDGEGNWLDVQQSLSGDRVQVGERTMRRMADGTYSDLHPKD